MAVRLYLRCDYCRCYVRLGVRRPSVCPHWASYLTSLEFKYFLQKIWQSFLRLSDYPLGVGWGGGGDILNCLFQPNRVLVARIIYRHVQPPLWFIDLFLRCYYLQPSMICKNILGLIVTPFLLVHISWGKTHPRQLLNEIGRDPLIYDMDSQSVGRNAPKTQIAVIIHKKDRKILICFTFHL